MLGADLTVLTLSLVQCADSIRIILSDLFELLHLAIWSLAQSYTVTFTFTSEVVSA